MSTSTKSFVRGFGAITLPGSNLPSNEDHYIAVRDKQLFGIADGYGGVGAGDVAAKQTLECMKFFIEHGLGDSEVTLPFVYRSYYSASANLLFNGLLYANQKLYTQNKSKPTNARGGASVTGLFFEGPHVTIASIGGCQVLLLREGKILPILKPRTYQAYKSSCLNVEQFSQGWSFPLMSMGHTADLEPEIVELQVKLGDFLLMLTDGVYGTLSESDFHQCFSASSLDRLDEGTLDHKIQQFNQGLMRKGCNDENKALVSIVCG